MASSLLLLLVLPMAVGAWKNPVIHQGRFHHKRPRGSAVWASPLGQVDRSRRSDFGGNRGCMSASSGDDSAASGSGFTDSSGKEWKDDGRDSLPFVVYDAAPPPRKIGVAKLPPLTSTGDTMWHGAKHYKVLCVSNQYKYEGGRFVVRRKSIQAKELKRVAKERVVSRLVYGDSGSPPPP